MIFSILSPCFEFHLHFFIPSISVWIIFIIYNKKFLLDWNFGRKILFDHMDYLYDFDKVDFKLNKTSQMMQQISHQDTVMTLNIAYIR